jgi:hypothetical protein
VGRDPVEAAGRRKSFLNQIRAALTYRPSLVRPGADLLTLAGRRDRLCDCRSSIRIHQVWGGTLAIHPWAGHDLPLDDPRWVVQQIQAWLLHPGFVHGVDQKAQFPEADSHGGF